MRHALQIVPVLIALMVVCTAFVPVASAGGQSRLEQDMLQMANITVNSLDTQLIDYWKVDDTLFFEGFVNFDAESNIQGTVKRIVADQDVHGYVCDDGSYHIESIGEDRSSTIDARKVLEDPDSVTYRVDQTVIVNGVVKTTSESVTVPKNQNEEDIAPSPIESGGEASARAFVDLPSLAPPGSILIFNDIRYSDLMWGSTALAVIASYFGVVPGVIVGLVAVALQAIPEYYDFDPDDVYLDVWLTPNPSNIIYVEVDYLYI